MKQIEEEYYKSDEKATQAPQQGNTSATTTTPAHDLYPPSPNQPIQSMEQHVPEPVKEAVNSLIRSHASSADPKYVTE